MEEVITRRLRHSIENSNGGFGKLPDVIFADGGITQIRATKQAIQNVLNEQKEIIMKEDITEQDKQEKLEMLEKELDIKVCGMVKNDKHQTRALMDEDRNELTISDTLMKLITRFQDTVHDTAITYHRKLRDKEITKSELDDIKGIGNVKKLALLKEFGSVEMIKQASVDQLMKVKGITRDLAERLKE